MPDEHPPFENLASRLDAYHAIVGRIASEWASLEFSMDCLIWQLARVDKKAGSCITSQITGTGTRMRIIIALLYMRSIKDDIIKKFRSFESDLFNDQLKRNRIIHDSWSYNENNQIGQLRNAIVNKKIDFSFIPIDFNELLKTHKDFALKSAEFRALMGNVFDVFPPSGHISVYLPRHAETLAIGSG